MNDLRRGPSVLRWALPPLLIIASLVLAVACAEGDDASDGEGASATWSHRDKLYAVASVGDRFWVVGYPGVVLASRDGGATWQALDCGCDEALYDIDFIDEKTGFISGRAGLVLRTNDGGETWTKLKTGTLEPLLALDFVDAKRGWAVGNFAVVLHTEDAGETWTRQEVPPPSEQEMMDGAPDEPVLNAVVFTDARTGWIAGEAGTLLHTADGGATWTRQASETKRALFGIEMDSAGRGVAVGSGGAILETSDGGVTWKTKGIDIPVPLLDVYAGGERTWACGRSGLLVRRAADGYKARREGTYVWLDSVAFDAKGAGVAVGRAGTMLRTSDGGASWLRVAIPR